MYLVAPRATIPVPWKFLLMWESLSIYIYIYIYYRYVRYTHTVISSTRYHLLQVDLYAIQAVWRNRGAHFGGSRSAAEQQARTIVHSKHAVSQRPARPPYLLAWNPTKAAQPCWPTMAARLATGQGICRDTGGLSLLGKLRIFSTSCTTTGARGIGSVFSPLSTCEGKFSCWLHGTPARESTISGPPPQRAPAP